MEVNDLREEQELFAKEGGYPLVSIIMPVYNAEKFLRGSISSVLNQTYPHYELVLVNDGSKDSSIDICNEFALKDKRIKVVDKVNEGVSVARNEGIRLSSGEFIAFIDSDDELDPQFLEKGLHGIERFDADVSVFAIKMKTIQDGKVIGEENYGLNQKEKCYSAKELLEVWGKEFAPICICAPFSKIYKAEIIRDGKILFDANMSRAEDTCFNLDFLENAKKIYFSNDIGYNYIRANSDSLYGKFHKDIYEIHEKVFDKLRGLLASLRVENDFVEKSYLANLINGIHEHFWHNDKTTKKEKLAYVKKIIQDKNVRKLKLKDFNLKQRMILLLIKLRAKRTLLFIMKKHHKQ